MSTYGLAAYLSPQTKVRSLALISASSMLGFSLGPFINGLMMLTFDIWWTFLPYMILSIICATVAYVKVYPYNLKMIIEDSGVQNPIKSLKEINLVAALIMTLAFL